jgi:hypothetical protein
VLAAILIHRGRHSLPSAHARQASRYRRHPRRRNSSRSFAAVERLRDRSDIAAQTTKATDFDLEAAIGAVTGAHRGELEVSFRRTSGNAFASRRCFSSAGSTRACLRRNMRIASSLPIHRRQS